jgi:hypothetical protein
MSEKLFSKEELDRLGRRTLDVLDEALEAGDLGKAKELSKRMYGEFLAMHDFYRDWLTHLFTIVGRRFGDEVLYQAMEETVAGYTERLSNRYSGKPVRRRLEILLAGLRGHLHPLGVEEDDEKFTITLEPCPSGGRQITDGCYDPPMGFLRVKNPQPMTFNRPEFPVYCTHCFFQNTTAKQAGGAPLFVNEPSANPGLEPCKIYLYK